jgi:site-specific DNA-adenine methylase
MKYPGGKGKTYQHIINLMPVHRVYIETHLGGGAVMRNKLPAARSIGIDADSRAIAAWSLAPMPGVEVVCKRAEEFLETYEFQGDELVYVDPPYHPATRRQERVYRLDYTQEDHERLAMLLRELPCMVILSGYANPVYERVLIDWGTRTFQAKTHTDVRTETLWFNFEPPQQLHDNRHIGNNFRERQTIRRRMNRLQERVSRMDAVERSAFIEWLNEEYPMNDRSSSP